MKSIVVIFILMFCITVTKPEVSPSLSPSVSCSTIIYDMIDCVLFLSGDNTEDKPTTACCSGFKIMLETNMKCFCEALESSAELGADVNLTKAVMLPSACEVSTSPINKCNLVSSPPSVAPVASPSPSESPIANSAERPIVSVSSETPTPSSPDKKVTPTPSTPAEEAVKHAPLPNLSGSHSAPSYLFVSFSMLVISFYYILV